MKSRSLVPVGAALAVALIAADLMAHGFAAPPLPVSSAPAASSSSSSSSSSGSSGAPAPGQTAPGGGSTGASGGGGATGGGGGAAGGAPGGARGARPARQLAARRDNGGGGDASAEAVGGAGASSVGSSFKSQLKADLALLKDRTVLLDVSCLDAALRKVELRVRINELRVSAADVRKRVDVETKNADAWQVRETYIINENGTVVSATAWTKDGGAKKMNSNPLDAAIGGTTITLRDVLPFDATTFATFSFLKASEVNFLAHETYTLKQPDGNGSEAVVTFRTDLRVPTHAEFMRSGQRHRAYDWTGWRYASGVVVPSRVSILGAALEPVATVDVREANINTNVNPALFDATKLAGGELVSAPR